MPVPRHPDHPLSDKSVRTAFAHWHEMLATEGLLTELLAYRQALQRHTSPRLANNSLLQSAIDALRPADARAAELLERHYVWEEPASALIARFAVANATFYRWQTKALEKAITVLAGIEQQARLAQQRRVEERMDGVPAPQLIGVDEPIEQLVTHLTSTAPPILSIEGLGGIGKTTLAAAIVRRLFAGDTSANSPFDDFAWVSARTAGLGQDGMLVGSGRSALSTEGMVAGFVQQLMPDEAPLLLDKPEQALAVLQQRVKRIPHLLVIDNLETVEDLEALIPVVRSLAGPSRVLITSRKRLTLATDIALYPVPELSEPHALALVRQTGQHQGISALAQAGDEELHAVYETVGGNPLAILLVVGQLQFHPIAQVLADLRLAKGLPVENLYTYIYRRIWDNLDEEARDVLIAMAAVAPGGETLDFVASMTGAPVEAIRAAIVRLMSVHVVSKGGDLFASRYSIHSLTRSFLFEQVVRWG